MKLKRVTILLALILWLLGSQILMAHHVWLEPQGSDLLVAWGHGKDIAKYNPDFVRNPQAYDCAGKSLPVQINKKTDAVSLSFEVKPAVVTVDFDAGCWVKTTEGYKNETKQEAKGKYTVLQAWRVRQYAKALLRQCESYANPTGLAFEIVPQKDPYAMAPGEVLPILVLYDGKAVQGATIQLGDARHDKTDDALVTDQDGKAQVKLTSENTQLINATTKIPLKDDPDADVLTLSTTLIFGR